MILVAVSVDNDDLLAQSVDRMIAWLEFGRSTD